MKTFSGKQVRSQNYIHVSSKSSVSAELSAMIGDAMSVATSANDCFNVIRFDLETKTVGLLDYRDFFDAAFPELNRSWKVRLNTRDLSYRDYEQSLNRPILHRKELLLLPDHPRRSEYEKLTSELEHLGFFDDPVRIGFKLQWEALIRHRGFRVVGHQIVPIGNDEEATSYPLHGMISASGIARHLTALTRTTLSAPIQSLLRHRLLTEAESLFDYGCGKGGDLAGLKEIGINCSGWDPHFAPDGPLKAANVVNLGFVINVIEDPVERREALVGAWTLAQQALVVSAMIASEWSVQGTPYADGIVTGRNTFQKYFTQTELREYIASTLNVSPVSLAPGVFLAFKDEQLEQRFQSGRYRSRLRILSPPRVHAPKSLPNRARPTRPNQYELHKMMIDGVWARALELGREPIGDEVPERPQIEAALGSVKRAFNLAQKYHDLDALEQARKQRADDLLVQLALQAFEHRTQYKSLDSRLQSDVHSFFGNYKTAQREGRVLLLSSADPDNINRSCQVAAEQGLGFFIPDQSLELHSSLVMRLPPLLRVYVGCASQLYGEITQADLVKIHIGSGKVSFMKFDSFDDTPLPRLVQRTKINLRTQFMQFFEYGGEYKPPILYLKSRYMDEEGERYPEQLAFDEELQSLIDLAGYGPGPELLSATLKNTRRKIVGFRIVRDNFIPNLDDLCGRSFAYRQLIECGETQRQTQQKNLPVEPETYTALYDLATEILDPVVEYFGAIELTYGFCSPQLIRHIEGSILPTADQHSSHERHSDGRLICLRKGAAVDFVVRDEDMREVASWIVNNLPFDRLYYYGPSRPLHVSYGPDHARKAYEMVPTQRGTAIPRPFRNLE